VADYTKVNLYSFLDVRNSKLKTKPKTKGDQMNRRKKKGKCSSEEKPSEGQKGIWGGSKILGTEPPVQPTVVTKEKIKPVHPHNDLVPL
jgi:hypothetical protein